jgi:hypothetical protein
VRAVVLDEAGRPELAEVPEPNSRGLPLERFADEREAHSGGGALKVALTR